MQQKHVEPYILGHMPYAPYVCQAEVASIIGGGAPPWITENIITMKPQAAGPQWASKELNMVLTQFKNGFHLHPNADPK